MLTTRTIFQKYIRTSKKNGLVWQKSLTIWTKYTQKVHHRRKGFYYQFLIILTYTQYLCQTTTIQGRIARNQTIG